MVFSPIFAISRCFEVNQPTLHVLCDFGKSHLPVTTGFTNDLPMVQLSDNSLSDFVRQIVSGYRNACESKNVSLLLDLEDVSAPYDRKLVHKAVAAMVENAIESMPDGGELEATLINAEHQWELEIADSGEQKNHTERAVAPGDGDLPRIAEVEVSSQMGMLNQLSLLMNATVQSWNCPLGGTANVLVVPKTSTIEKPDSKAA
jgi:hypothetical protein